MSDWKELVNGLADGELEGVEASEAQRICETDDRAKKEYEWACTCKQNLATKCNVEIDYKPKEEAYKRIGIINTQEARIEHWIGRHAWSICLVFLLILAGGFWSNRVSSSQDVSPAYVAGVFNSLVPDRAKATDRSNAPIQLENGPYRIVGADRAEIQGRDVARIDFRDAYGVFHLLILWDSPKGVTGMVEQETLDGMCAGLLNDIPCVMWTEDGKTLILLGDRSHREFAAIAKTISIVD